MHDWDWDRLWERQGKRLDLAEAWWRRVGGRPGMRLADVGCGPGRLALLYAERAGPEGQVLALDEQAEALVYCEARRDPTRHAALRTRRHDAERDPIPEAPLDAVLLTDVLHHLRDPAAVLRHAREAAPLVLVAEFDPSAPGDVGPPLEMRISPEQVRAWLEQAGWRPGAVEPQGYEHYTFLAQRA